MVIMRYNHRIHDYMLLLLLVYIDRCMAASTLYTKCVVSRYIPGYKECDYCTMCNFACQIKCYHTMKSWLSLRLAEQALLCEHTYVGLYCVKLGIINEITMMSPSIKLSSKYLLNTLCTPNLNCKT